VAADLFGSRDTTWLCHWENGDSLPSLVSIMRLSMLYGTPIEDLFADLLKTIRDEIPEKG